MVIYGALMVIYGDLCSNTQTKAEGFALLCPGLCECGRRRAILRPAGLHDRPGQQG